MFVMNEYLVIQRSVQPQVIPVSAKEDHTKNIFENIFGSEMVAQRSQPQKSIKAKDTRGQSKLQIPPNSKQNPSSEMRQNNVVMTISNKV